MALALERLVLPALNHLLAAEPWASERLRAHRGAHFRVEAGFMAMQLAIDHNGHIAAADENAVADVTLALPADAPLRLIFERDALFSSVKLSGAADIAETLAFVFRNLRWDAEGDLAALIGDIPARRLVRFGRSLALSLEAAVRNSITNLAEYGVEEADLLVSKRNVAAFSDDVRKLQEDMAALERRISLLGR